MIPQQQPPPTQQTQQHQIIFEPNPLLAIPSPRQIPQVVESVNRIAKYDKLWLKNHDEYNAYRLMTEYFLSHEVYSHLCIIPDDLVVDYEKFELLIDNVRKHDFPVVSGYCNLGKEGMLADLANICIDQIPDIKATDRRYEWPLIAAMENHHRHAPTPIIRVKFAGFPLIIIRRDVLELETHGIRLIPDGSYNGDAEDKGCCVDVVFCWQCHVKDIPIYVNTRCRFEHLKWNDMENVRAAIEGRTNNEPRVIFEPAVI